MALCENMTENKPILFTISPAAFWSGFILTLLLVFWAGFKEWAWKLQKLGYSSTSLCKKGVKIGDGSRVQKTEKNRTGNIQQLYDGWNGFGRGGGLGRTQLTYYLFILFFNTHLRICLLILFFFDLIFIVFFPLPFSPHVPSSPQQSPHCCPCPWVLFPFWF